jgi:hypothetical protein
MGEICSQNACTNYIPLWADFIVAEMHHAAVEILDFFLLTAATVVLFISISACILFSTMVRLDVFSDPKTEIRLLFANR